MKSKPIRKLHNKKLGEICDIFSGGTPSTKNKNYWNGDILWLSSGETRNNFITYTDRKITLLGVKNSSTRLAKKNDVVVASAGQGNTRGQVSLCLINTYVNQSIIVIRSDISMILPKYLFYNLKSRYNELRRLSDSHSSRGSLPKNILSLIYITLPTLSQQEKISKILYDLDCQIINLQNQNKILEQITQAIFKSWFVDFDGITEFVDSKLGKIPKKWRVVKLQDFISLQKGISYKGKYLDSKGIPMINLGNISKNGGFINHKIKYYTGEFKTHHMINSYDIIIANTDITQDRLVLGSAAIVPPLNNSNIIFTHHIFSVINKSKLNNYFLYGLLQTCRYRSHVISYATGTTVLAIPKEAILDFEFAYLGGSMHQKFENIASIIHKLIINNNFKINNLIKIRDTLLPKLMSREIQI